MNKNKLAVAVAATFLVASISSIQAADEIEGAGASTETTTEEKVHLGQAQSSIEKNLEKQPENEGLLNALSRIFANQERKAEKSSDAGTTETETTSTEGSTETDTASTEEEKVHLGQAQSSLEKNLEAQPENEGLLNALSNIFNNQERHELEGKEKAEFQRERINVAERPDRPERAERPERPDRPERPERPDRPEKPDRPERP